MPYFFLVGSNECLINDNLHYRLLETINRLFMLQLYFRQMILSLGNLSKLDKNVI